MTIGTLVALAVLALIGTWTAAGDDDEDERGTGAALSPETERLLELERRRLRKQFESELARARAEAAEQAKAELAAEAERAQKDALDLALEDKQRAEARAAAAEAAAAEAQATAARALFVAANAGGLDRAWRVYLDTQLAQAAEDESPEDVLARVLAEHAAETGREKPHDLGAPGRPAHQPEITTDTNPWLPESRNLTAQGRIIRDNPEQAARLMRAAGRPEAEIARLTGG